MLADGVETSPSGAVFTYRKSRVLAVRTSLGCIKTMSASPHLRLRWPGRERLVLADPGHKAAGQAQGTRELPTDRVRFERWLTTKQPLGGLTTHSRPREKEDGFPLYPAQPWRLLVKPGLSRLGGVLPTPAGRNTPGKWVKVAPFGRWAIATRSTPYASL